MNRTQTRLILVFAALTGLTEPAFAHHLMGGRTPATFGEGILSGLGHPIIGLDHFAAVVAVGCLAAAHRAGMALAVGFVEPDGSRGRISDSVRRRRGQHATL